jgi:hypothetical protein
MKNNVVHTTFFAGVEYSFQNETILYKEGFITCKVILFVHVKLLTEREGQQCGNLLLNKVKGGLYTDGSFKLYMSKCYNCFAQGHNKKYSCTFIFDRITMHEAVLLSTATHIS